MIANFEIAPPEGNAASTSDTSAGQVELTDQPELPTLSHIDTLHEALEETKTELTITPKLEPPCDYEEIPQIEQLEYSPENEPTDNFSDDEQPVSSQDTALAVFQQEDDNQISLAPNKRKRKRELSKKGLEQLDASVEGLYSCVFCEYTTIRAVDMKVMGNKFQLIQCQTINFRLTCKFIEQLERNHSNAINATFQLLQKRNSSFIQNHTQEIVIIKTNTV